MDIGLMKRIAAAAFALVLSAGASSAITINPGDHVHQIVDVAAGTTPTFDYDTSKALKITGISVGGSTLLETDLAMVTFGLVSPLTTFTWDFTAGPIPGSGLFQRNVSILLPAGFAFQLFVDNPSTRTVGITFDMITAAIPVPAALPLLLGGLGALGAIGARRRRAAA